MSKKDTKAEHYKRAASNLMMTNESERELLRPEPTESLFNPDDWGGMTEEEAFEEDPGGVLSILGTQIASQAWSHGSWSYVYEYKGKNFHFYFPVVTSLILSAFLALIFWLVSLFTNR